MDINVSFSEIHNYIEKHYGQDVKLSKESCDTVRVVASKKMLINVSVPVNIKIERVTPSSVTICYDAFMGVDYIISGILSYVLGKYPEIASGVLKEKDNRVSVNLALIEKAESIIEKLDLKSISVEDDGLRMIVKLK